MRPPDRSALVRTTRPNVLAFEPSVAIVTMVGIARMSPYWKCQIAGWTMAGLVAAAIPSLYGGLRWVVVGRAVLGAVLGLVLTDQLRRHMRRNRWLTMTLPDLAPRVLAASFAIAAAMVLGVMPLLLAILRTPSRGGPLLAIFASHVAIVLGWSLIYIGYRYLEEIRAAEAEKWRLKLAARETELGALRSQLNPHFLFNSLNSLRGLVIEDPARAQEAITGLAGLLRHTLQLSRTGTTTLARELEATEHYLELEALRFESRLRYEIDVEERAREHPIPPMLIQTLVENAIKHGISRLPDGGMVRIEARQGPEEFCLRVTNTGRLAGNRVARGVGLANSLERLRLAFGDDARLELVQSGPDEVTCEVLIPRSPGSPSLETKPPAGDSGAMRALIVDDERLARNELRRLLGLYPDVEIVGEAANARDARTALQDLEPELLFLDVQMPGETGFDLLASLDSVPLVVFTTAYDEFALRAFEVSALDYLVKPIDPKRLASTMSRLPARLEPGPRERELSERHRVFVSEGERCWLVKLGDIRLFEAEGNDTRLFFGEEKPLIAPLAQPSRGEARWTAVLPREPAPDRQFERGPGHPRMVRRAPEGGGRGRS